MGLFVFIVDRWSVRSLTRTTAYLQFVLPTHLTGAAGFFGNYSVCRRLLSKSLSRDSSHVTRRSIDITISVRYSPYASLPFSLPCHSDSDSPYDVARGTLGWFAIAYPAVMRAIICDLANGSGDSSPTLCKGHRGMFIKIHQLLPADETPILTSIRGAAHALMNHPTCETPG